MITSEPQGHEDVLEELLKLGEVEDRIRLVADDVRTNTDRFRSIPPHELAEALGVPQPECPADWEFICSAEIRPIEECAANVNPVSELVYLVQDEIEPDRFHELVDQFSSLDELAEPNFSFLTNDEKQLLEVALAQQQLGRNLENGIGTIARYNLKSGDMVLSFEATIEDDGSCIYLLTPYEHRDGYFRDFTNTVMECW